MKSSNDLRGYLDILEAKGLLVRVKREINKDTEGEKSILKAN